MVSVHFATGTEVEYEAVFNNIESCIIQSIYDRSEDATNMDKGGLGSRRSDYWVT